MTRYKLVTASNENDLEEAVQYFLDKDWTVQGGIAVIVDQSSGNIELFQALIKERD